VQGIFGRKKYGKLDLKLGSYTEQSYRTSFAVRFPHSSNM